MHHPTDRIAHTTAFVTPVVEHWLERQIAHYQLSYPKGSLVRFNHRPPAYQWVALPPGYSRHPQEEERKEKDKEDFDWSF